MYSRNAYLLQVYRFDDLPAKLVGKYNLASDFVQLNRTITPKVTLFGSRAKCMVMESGNASDYQVGIWRRRLVEKWNYDV